jgi:hypothetical protein
MMAVNLAAQKAARLVDLVVVSWVECLGLSLVVKLGRCLVAKTAASKAKRSVTHWAGCSAAERAVLKVDKSVPYLVGLLDYHWAEKTDLGLAVY